MQPFCLVIKRPFPLSDEIKQKLLWWRAIDYVGIVSLLFMQVFAAFFCSVTQRVSMWGGTFRDDSIIGWARRELVPEAAVLSCHATLFPVAWWEKKSCCDGERLIGNAFQWWYVVDAKYITTASGKPILSWVTTNTTRLPFFSLSRGGCGGGAALSLQIDYAVKANVVI